MEDSKRPNHVISQLKFERYNLKYNLDEVNSKITKYIRHLKDCEDEYIRSKWDNYCEKFNYEFNDDTKKEVFVNMRNEEEKWKNIVNGNDVQLEGITQDMYNLLTKCCNRIRRLIKRRDRIIEFIAKLDKQIVLISEYEDTYYPSI